MTDQEHLREIKQMSEEKREEIERRMLVEMAERYGVLLKASRRGRGSRARRQKTNIRRTQL